MIETPIPLVILGGRDRGASHLPEAGRDKHPLRGYKALELSIEGRPLVSIVAERFRATGLFDPIAVAGPAALYNDRVPRLDVIDTDGSFGDNLQAAVRWLGAEESLGEVAFTTGDILPDAAELANLLDDFRRRRPCDFWMPQIRAEVAALGASGWKPKYRFAPESGGEPVTTLPGHLVIADAGALRRKLVYRMFELAYRTRNRSVTYRKVAILRSLLLSLLRQDLALALSLRPPLATWEVGGSGWALARGLRSGTMTTDHLADLVRKIYVLHRHRREHPERRGHFPVLDGLSLAKDFDTEEEAREVGAFRES